MRYAIFLTFLANTAFAASIDLEHNINLKWTTQVARQEGGVSPGFSLFSLRCFFGECTLVEVALNGCFGKGPDAFFIPGLKSWATLDGNLKVSVKDADIGISYETADWTHHHRFNVKTDDLGLMSIVSYVGNAVHDVRTQTQTYVIVRHGETRQFDCKIMLSGLSVVSPKVKQKSPQKTP